MAILIQDDGIITPFNIQSSNETKISLLPATRDTTEEKEAADGDIDFGTEYGMGEFILHGIIEFDTVDERNSIETILKGLLNNCRVPQELTYECQPNEYIAVRLTGKPEINENLHHLEVRVRFKADPFWLSVIEHIQVGTGTIVNAGTFDTPLIIEITGPVTNPSVTIGTDVLTYTGTISAGQTLVIDTGAQTAKIGTVNAMVGYNGVFPIIQPGSANVTAGSNVTIRWRDKYI